MAARTDRAERATDSLKKRYAYKVGANFAGMGFAAVTQVLTPRGLGPEAYGDFNFLSNFFTQFVQFLDTGTSLGFYTKLSQRPEDRGLVTFYLGISGLICALVVLATLAVLPTRLSALIWPAQRPSLIMMGAIYGLCLWLTQMLNKMADAYGLTVPSELARLLQKVVAFALIVALFFSSAGRFGLRIYFYYQYLILGLLAATFIIVMRRHGSGVALSPLPVSRIKEYGREFYDYSQPLFVYATVVGIAGIADRWLLQRYGGSMQQGYFGLSFQVSAVCLLFTNAMTPLMIRELSIASAAGDIEGMAALFRKYVPVLYSIAAYFSCFLALQHDRVAVLAGGSQFKDAGLAIAIMSLFPIPATYGQLSGSIFYATNQTRLHRDIGSVSAVIGLLMTYFLVAPRSAWGLGAGATGLALKLVLHTFGTVNVGLYFNLKYLRLSFWRFLGHQIAVVAVLLGLAEAASLATDRMIAGEPVRAFLAAGLLYSMLVGASILAYPRLFGLQRPQLRSLLERARLRLTAAVS